MQEGERGWRGVTVSWLGRVSVPLPLLLTYSNCWAGVSYNQENKSAQHSYSHTVQKGTDTGAGPRPTHSVIRLQIYLQHVLSLQRTEEKANQKRQRPVQRGESPVQITWVVWSQELSGDGDTKQTNKRQGSREQGWP